VNERLVRQLTRKGCIIAKEAAEELEDSDVERIESLDSVPMYLSLDMLENLRETTEPEETQYTRIEFVSECPTFVGVDLEEYGAFEEGDKAELPEDNADIMVNRGMAEVAE
jgi:hypothetical protein